VVPGVFALSLIACAAAAARVWSLHISTIAALLASQDHRASHIICKPGAVEGQTQHGSKRDSLLEVSLLAVCLLADAATRTHHNTWPQRRGGCQDGQAIPLS